MLSFYVERLSLFLFIYTHSFLEIFERTNLFCPLFDCLKVLIKMYVVVWPHIDESCLDLGPEVIYTAHKLRIIRWPGTDLYVESFRSAIAKYFCAFEVPLHISCSQRNVGWELQGRNPLAPGPKINEGSSKKHWNFK